MAELSRDEKIEALYGAIKKLHRESDENGSSYYSSAKLYMKQYEINLAKGFTSFTSYYLRESIWFHIEHLKEKYGE